MAKDAPMPEKTVQGVEAVPEYEATEIAQNSLTLFGYSPDLATAALWMANIQRCSLNTAKNIIKAFAERKV